MLRLRTPFTVALLLSLSEAAFSPGRVEAVGSDTMAPRARRASGSASGGASQRIADRVMVRRVRGAIRSDPFLARAMSAVKVSGNRGVVRLSGAVRTDKERSSIAFKAGQTAGVERIDDRLTIGNGVERAAW